MKHQHTHAADGDVDLNVNIPTEDIEVLIEKATEAVITIIVVVTGAHILKSLFSKGES